MALDQGHYLFVHNEEHMIDTSRRELYPHSNGHPYREVKVHFWYPINDDKNSVILFSHGLGPNFDGMSYQWLCEYLASQGYVVVSVSHSYGCKLIELSEKGSVADYLYPVPSLHYQPGRDMFDVELETWINDMLYVLNQCERYNNRGTSFLFNKLNMESVAMIGHSLGGSTAVQVCRRDSRVKAAITLDGPLYGKYADTPFDKPVLFIMGVLGQGSVDMKNDKVVSQAFFWSWYMKTNVFPVIDRFFSAMRQNVWKVIVSGFVHEIFTDQGPDVLLKPWLIDHEQAHVIIMSYVQEFLDCYVKGHCNTSLEKLTIQWPEVMVEKK